MKLGEFINSKEIAGLKVSLVVQYVVVAIVLM